MFGGGGKLNLHITSIWVKVNLHNKIHLPRLHESAIKFCCGVNIASSQEIWIFIAVKISLGWWVIQPFKICLSWAVAKRKCKYSIFLCWQLKCSLRIEMYSIDSTKLSFYHNTDHTWTFPEHGLYHLKVQSYHLPWMHCDNIRKLRLNLGGRVRAPLKCLKCPKLQHPKHSIFQYVGGGDSY